MQFWIPYPNRITQLSTFRHFVMMSTSQPPDSPDERPVFPQELFDRLIDLVKIGYPRDPCLLNCSLVSKAWAHRSRKRIFRQVRLTSQTHFRLWCKNITPGPGGPSSLVRVLIFSQAGNNKWITPGNLLEGGEHLMSFTDLNGLVIFNLHSLDFKDPALLFRCFHVIGRGIRFVRLHHVEGTPRTIASFIQQFSKTQTLAIEYYTEAPDPDTSPEEPTKEADDQFQGILQLLSFRFEELAVIDSIARLPLRYQEIHLWSSLFFVEPYNRLFSACAPTLERLRIVDTRSTTRTHWAKPIDSPGITVASCTELQMVRLGTSKKPGPMLENFLKSIDPSNLRQLAFEFIWHKYTDDDITSVADIPAWEPIDDTLCILARRIRAKHPERGLDVVLSVVAPPSIDLAKVRLGSFFSKFREEGCIVLQHFIDHLPPGVYSSEIPPLVVGGLQ